MAEYIDRKSTLAVFQDIDPAGNHALYMDEIRADIQAIPAADVVKVVRCKDCQYFEADVWANVNGIPIIVAHEICRFWGGGRKTSSDAYCSYGVKRDG